MKDLIGGEGFEDKAFGNNIGKPDISVFGIADGLIFLVVVDETELNKEST